jgi:ankyrin repeat protein
MESPGWGTVLPHLRDGLAMLDSKIVQAIAEGLFKQSIRTNHQMMLDLSIGLGASPTQPIKYFDAYKGRHVLSTPLVAICKGYNERPESGHSPEKLIRSLLKADTHISNSRLLWIIRAGCHAIAEEEIRSRPGREINFAITVSDLEEGRWLSFDTYDPVTPLLVACSDPRHSAEKLSLIRCLLQHNAEADLEAMIAAAGAGDEEVILLLHQHGAPINGHIPGLGSPLSSACKAHLCPSYRHSRSVTAISLLLELGASPNSPDDGDLDSWELSPLHICALSREEESVEEALDLLIDYGADVNHRAKFHPIVYFRCAQVAVHASVNVKLAETALEYAIQSSHWTSAIQLLSANCELTGREILFVDISGYEVGRRAAPDEDFREFLDALLTKAPSQAATRHWNGLTLLQRAIEHEHEDMILALFTHGVTPTPSDFLCMLRNRMPERAEVSRLSSNTQMQLLLAARKYSADHSAFKLILAFACPEVVRNVLNSCPNVYDSEGLCYVIARITTKDQVSYYLAYWVSDEEEDQQADSLTIGDLQALVSRRNASNSNEDWESTAVTIAARAGRADILRILTRSCQDHTGGHGLIPSFLLKEVLMVDHKMVGPTSTDVDERNTGFVGIWIKYCGMDDPNMRCSPLTAAAMVVPETVAGEVIDLLLALGYRPDGWTVLVASRQGYLSILQRLRQLDSWPHILNHRDRPDWCPTALQTAVYSSHHSAVRFLLDEGTTMDAMDLCPCRPFYFTPPEIVRPAAPNTILPRTSLQHAVGNEDMELVTLLVNAGANVNAPAAKDSGATALQIASIQGSIPMVQYLISQGADPHATGAAIHGRTALEGAAEHGRKDVVELLLGHGESTAYQRHEQLAKALLRAEKSAQCVVSAILREQLLLQRCSEDEKTLDMLEEDWESSSERSGHFEMRTDIEAWGETCDDWQNSLRLYERNSSSYMRQEEPHENPVAPQEEGSCFVPGMDWGREGHGRPDLHQNSEIDIYGGDIVLDLALQDDTPSWVDVQRGLERYDGVDMLLDDVL